MDVVLFTWSEWKASHLRNSRQFAGRSLEFLPYSRPWWTGGQGSMARKQPGLSPGMWSFPWSCYPRPEIHATASVWARSWKPWSLFLWVISVVSGAGFANVARMHPASFPPLNACHDLPPCWDPPPLSSPVRWQCPFPAHSPPAPHLRIPVCIEEGAKYHLYSSPLCPQSQSENCVTS